MRRHNLARQSGPIPRNAGGRPGTNRRSYRHADDRSEKPARLKHVCLALDRMPKMRREDEANARLAFPGRLSRTGRWQTTQPRRTYADQQHCRCVFMNNVGTTKYDVLLITHSFLMYDKRYEYTEY
jgi:hypothetical protein